MSGRNSLRPIVDMKTYLKVKSSISDTTKQLTSVLEHMPPQFRIIIVSLAVSVLPSVFFTFEDAWNHTSTYCAGLNIENINKSQFESALDYFLQNSILEVSGKSTMRKLGKGSRSFELEKVSF